ncbi:DUF2180 family protein [Streptomyces atratus]
MTHCLDCRTAGTNSPTVGVCQGCGAGVCAAHAPHRDPERGQPDRHPR